MTAESVCFAALPAALPVTLFQAAAGEGVATRTLALSDSSDGSPRTIAASFLAPRVLPRLFRESAQAASEAQAALTGAGRLIVLLPAGRYDDGVWAPIIERILLGLDSAAARPREIAFAWSGLEPFLAPLRASCTGCLERSTPRPGAARRAGTLRSLPHLRARSGQGRSPRPDQVRACGRRSRAGAGGARAGLNA
ncbi:hypothetical protein QO058_18515 [Bosea vestrisii]|uniref:hypothetical protein n=1 Tax=Bosea vestrisii TaxID=151416 RepID=UPI0024DF41F2|nr:hypothetical protein [Bosea vestrisii]WID94809.1 hypothetical protein QO058_18515 [Bosea vestrisii]